MRSKHRPGVYVICASLLLIAVCFEVFADDSPAFSSQSWIINSDLTGADLDSVFDQSRDQSRWRSLDNFFLQISPPMKWHSRPRPDRWVPVVRLKHRLHAILPRSSLSEAGERLPDRLHFVFLKFIGSTF